MASSSSRRPESVDGLGVFLHVEFLEISVNFFSISEEIEEKCEGGEGRVYGLGRARGLRGREGSRFRRLAEVQRVRGIEDFLGIGSGLGLLWVRVI
eukprot:1352472-Amorphochlora_amoeboformis.AAC.1